MGVLLQPVGGIDDIVIYVAKLDSTLYVLHCFQKKTRATRKSDLDLAQSRYRDLLTELGR